MTKLFDVDVLKVPADLTPVAVSLRSLSLTDAAGLLALTTADHEALAPWLSWAERAPIQEDVERFLAHCKETEVAGSERHFAILVDGKLSGVLGCAPIDRGNRSVTVGYWLTREHWGRGIVSSSLRTLAVMLLQSRDFERIEARCAVGNSRGNRVVELAGFKREGLLRRAQRVGERYHDLNLYSLIRSDLPA